ncbi:MAG: DUF58 domain-containing protein [Thermoleophilaceae bacterium]
MASGAHRRALRPARSADDRARAPDHPRSAAPGHPARPRAGRRLGGARPAPARAGDRPGGIRRRGGGPGQDGRTSRSALRARAAGSAAELDLDGLRAYRTGTPASRIHWPAVARSGEMLERRLTAEADSAPLVVLDTTRPPSPEALDAAVRAAASLCVHLARRGGAALLMPGDRRPAALAADMAGWPALHVRLALVEAASARPALARIRRAGAVLWVSARADPHVTSRAPRPAWAGSSHRASGKRRAFW